MQPEFILVTGANGTGKTTLIESNRSVLEAAGFKIIIPDNILKYATSHTDAPAVIQEHVDNALSQRSNFILESPFQFQSLITTIDQIRETGYSLSLYQLFVDNVMKSAIRVKDRFKEGGLYINTSQVEANFNANLNNVGGQYDRFDHAYFIDNSTNREMKLAAEFKGPLLIRYHSIASLYLRDLFEQEGVMEKIDRHTLKVIQANKDYTSEVLRQSLPRRRLKF